MKALLVQMNTSNVANQLKEKILDSSIVKKIIAIISGPVLAYITQLVQGIGFLSDFLLQLGLISP
jgi:hypothetical protein